MGVQVGAGGEELPRVGLLVPLEDLGGVAGVEQEHVAGLDHDVVRGHDLLERGQVDPPPVVAQVVGQVDEDAAALHPVEGHVLQSEVAGEGGVPAAVAPGVVARADEVDPGPVAVVVDALLDPVAVGVELGPDVGEGVPLGRVLQGEGDHVVGPDVDVLGIAEVRHLAHVDVVEGVGDALHVLGRRHAGRRSPLVQGRPAREVEGQAQAEADPGFDLAHPLEDLLGGEQVDASELVVVPPVPPRRTVRALLPPLGHGRPP